MKRPSFLAGFRVGRDQIFWLVLGIILVLYAVFELDPISFGIALVALLMAITVHEFAHAWTADLLGDPTARRLGRVSLNPLAHLDPLGSLIMVMSLISGIGIGWGKPVPLSPHRLRYGPRLGAAIVSLAGPVANLLLALVTGLALRWLPITQAWLLIVLDTIAWVNIIIAVFNLIPIPPLDGSSVLLGILSLIRGSWAQSLASAMGALQRQGYIVLLVVVLVSQFLGLGILGWLIGGPSELIYGLITGV